MSRRDRVIGAAMAVAAATGLAWASTGIVKSTHDDAVLRLTWTARPERIETCRTQTAEELATLPVHMRQPVVCTGESAAYRLQVRRGDKVLLDEIVHGGGWRRDRPLYVFHDLPQSAGDADVNIRFERLGDGTVAHTTTGVSADGRFISDLPAVLTLEQRFRFRTGTVTLVTYDSERRALTAVLPESR